MSRYSGVKRLVFAVFLLSLALPANAVTYVYTGNQFDFAGSDITTPCDPGSTEPHCTAPPTCAQMGCPTDDPCFPAQCLNDRCVPLALAGLDSARCVCERPLPDECAGIPPRFTRRAARACKALDRAANATKERKVPRYLSNARRAWERAARQAGRRVLHERLTPKCGAALQADYDDARTRAERLIELPE